MSCPRSLGNKQVMQKKQNRKSDVDQIMDAMNRSHLQFHLSHGLCVVTHMKAGHVITFLTQTLNSNFIQDLTLIRSIRNRSSGESSSHVEFILRV